MPRGGARPGAGRKAGGQNKVALAAAAAPVLSGESPITFLSRIMNDAGQLTKDRIEAAKAMLPYIHKRQPQAIEHQNPDGTALEPVILRQAIIIKDGDE